VFDDNQNKSQYVGLRVALGVSRGDWSRSALNSRRFYVAFTLRARSTARARVRTSGIRRNRIVLNVGHISEIPSALPPVSHGLISISTMEDDKTLDSVRSRPVRTRNCRSVDKKEQAWPRGCRS